MSRVLVTGAAGFTGRYLTSLLAAQGHDVHGVAHHAREQPVAGAASMYAADLSEYDAIKSVVDEVRPEHIVHLAAIAFVGHADVGEMYRANIVGTRQLLEALSGLRITPKSVIIASSANVYGNQREGILDESMQPAPANDYGVSKAAAEQVSHLYADKLPLIVVRPFNYTGRGQAANFLIPKIVDHARRRAPAIELGNLDVKRDFSDVRNVVDAYARLLSAPEAIGQTLNISSGHVVSLSSVLETVRRLTGHSFEVRVNPALVRDNEVRVLGGSPEKIERIIGPLNAIPLEETLRWMLAPE